MVANIQIKFKAQCMHKQKYKGCNDKKTPLSMVCATSSHQDIRRMAEASVHKTLLIYHWTVINGVSNTKGFTTRKPYNTIHYSVSREAIQKRAKFNLITLLQDIHKMKPWQASHSIVWCLSTTYITKLWILKYLNSKNHKKNSFGRVAEWSIADEHWSKARHLHC